MSDVARGSTQSRSESSPPSQSLDTTPRATRPEDIPLTTMDEEEKAGDNTYALPDLPLSSEISIAIDPVALITTECITITSAMRKHGRWAHTTVSTILGGSPNPSTSTFQSSRPSTPAEDRIGKKEARIRPLTGDDDAGSLASRWGLRGKKGKSLQDNPLMAGFAKLRREVADCKDIRSFDTPTLLYPFLQVIQASATSAPITSLALISITKFFSYNLISYHSPRLHVAMQSLSGAITHCRFEASESAADEIVLLRILKLMEDMLSGPGGTLLSDESVCEMMETGLSMCCQSRLSELLRRTAEMSMIKMCQIIFQRLKQLEVEADDASETLDEQTKEDMNGVKMAPSATANPAVKSSLAVLKSDDVRASTSLDVPRPSLHEDPSVTGSDVVLATTTSDAHVKPYSLPSIRELFRVLVDLLDPHDKQHADAMRVMALRIIDVALEVAGPSIASHPSLARLAEDVLCRHLFQLVRSDNMAILHESLIVAGTLLATCRSVLKLQQELFLSYMVTCLHPRVEIPRELGIDPSLYADIPQAPKLAKPAPPQNPGQSSGRSTPVPVKDRRQLGMEGGARKPDAREAMVESVAALIRIPSFMVELYVNYDCEVDRADLCEDMVGLLARNSIPDAATWSTTSVPPLCLDALLGYVSFIASRLDQEPITMDMPNRNILREQRRRKKYIIKGLGKFNESPKAGLAYLASQGILSDLNDPLEIATFLKGTSRVSKKQLGEYISKKGNDAVLDAFLGCFVFENKRVDEALRELLESFRLPGESQLIERIVTTFAEKYFANWTPDGVANQDAVYVLTYAIIMLNTDQHNPNLKPQNRMSYEQFARNLRGVNNGADFSADYLQDIFDSIKSNEIILPEEHDNKLAFDYAWKELLLKTESAGDLTICATNAFDADMFAATWKPVVATLSYVFMSATDDAVFHRVIAGFDQCSRIATKYGLTEVIDRIVYSLSFISTLATEAPSNTVLNTQVEVEKKNVMVSELAVKFGRDFKAQLATVILFRVVNGSETVIAESWQHIVRIWLNLFVNSLIPAFFQTSTNQLDIEPIPISNPVQVVDRGPKSGDVGLFASFTSYISSYAADDPPEPSDEELEATLCTVDCVNACQMGDVFANVVKLPLPTLQPLVSALLSQLPEDESSTIVSVKTEMPPSVPTNGLRSDSPVYEPAVVYVLELCTVITIRDDDTIQKFGGDVADALQNIIRYSAYHHQTTVARVVMYLFTLLHLSYDHAFVRVPVVLHAIASFTPDLLYKCSAMVLKGISMCIQSPGPLRNELTTSPDFWVILRALSKTPSTATSVFEILEDVVTGESPPSIMADNYEAAIALLDEFASYASVGAITEQKQDRRSRRGAPIKQKEKPTQDPIVSRGVKAIAMMFQLTPRIPDLVQQSHLECREAWTAYWSPIFNALTTQCTNPCREIRHQAFSALQRSLVSKSLTAGNHDGWITIFDEVLFPLIHKLLKPEVYSTDPAGMSETRVQAATLTCRIFLHHLVSLSKWEGMLELWLRILDIMDRLMNSGQADSLEEAVPESLKNILLVMSSSGYLQAPTSPDQSAASKELWTQTWKRIDRFLPDLKQELDLEAGVEGKVDESEKRGEDKREVGINDVEQGSEGRTENENVNGQEAISNGS